MSTSEKNRVGAPPMYNDVKEMQRKIDAYFKKCEKKPITDKDGNIRTDKYGRVLYHEQKPPTVTGLALALGFTSRQALLNYQEKEEFVDTVTRAKARIEEFAEERLYDSNSANGAKFTLANNFKGWSEKQEIDQSLSVRKLEDLL